MVIYVDSLIFTNIVVDYFLLLLTAKLTKMTYKLIRIIPAAAVGGFSSLYIFVENTSTLIDIAFRFVSGCIIILIAQSLKSVKNFITAYAVFMLLCFVLNGIIEFIYSLNLSKVLFVENSVEYINVSPVMIVVFTGIIYIIISLIKKIISKSTRSKSAELLLSVCGFELKLNALIDTGHNICDPLSDSKVIIVDPRYLKTIIEHISEEERDRRKRLVPANTVVGGTLLDGIRCDLVDVKLEDKNYIFYKPIAAASNEKLGGEQQAIISDSYFNRLSER